MVAPLLQRLSSCRIFNFQLLGGFKLTNLPPSGSPPERESTLSSAWASSSSISGERRGATARAWLSVVCAHVTRTSARASAGDKNGLCAVTDH